MKLEVEEHGAEKYNMLMLTKRQLLEKYDSKKLQKHICPFKVVNIEKKI